jgi:ABC-type branched-subunit amino acid transport system ATPase component
MPDAIIVTEGIQKRFGDVEALKGIDLEVTQGSVLGLLGRVFGSSPPCSSRTRGAPPSRGSMS